MLFIHEDSVGTSTAKATAPKRRAFTRYWLATAEIVNSGGRVECTRVMASRPGTAASGGGGQHRKPIQGALRPQSAALLLDSPSRQTALTQSLGSRAAGGNGTKGTVGASSEDLIRDLEHKVRRVVEQKRGESDKLRFALTKKREEVERAKLVLQDLIKESEALGLHYQSSDNQSEEPPALSGRGTRHGNGDSVDCDLDTPIIEEPGRLQPIASISRRPVYSKHSNITELEMKLEKRASETHQVHRRTLVLEHIKKRLLVRSSSCSGCDHLPVSVSSH